MPALVTPDFIYLQIRWTMKTRCLRAWKCWRTWRDASTTTLPRALFRYLILLQCNTGMKRKEDDCSFNELITRATNGGLDANLKKLMAVTEQKLAWLVYIIGAFIGGRTVWASYDVFISIS
ncbi:hypothetical protein BC936DRAFT_142619 [Jimgerdemannia flammicorona]|uniref:Exportin-7/Ran-binding protein 17 TPR repeats domain-containing protein n=1 Tax=Jimgerdemannia flammicorona TaxID=994334 RepID=A0A433A055_9FUNG|nr:hypothetical protein BC936DRAFT_142619 [Jimgerdemannia flammicorona]